MRRKKGSRAGKGRQERKGDRMTNSTNKDNTAECEKHFLGALLTPDYELPELSIEPCHFQNRNHGIIFQAYLNLKRDGKQPDIILLCNDTLIKEKEIGRDYIASLTNDIPSAVNILYYEEIIINSWKKRECKKIFYEKIDDPAYADNIEVVLQETQNKISCNKKDKNITTLTEIKAKWDTYDPDNDFKPPLLDGMAIRDGTLTYIGARTGVGKTTAQINLTREGLDAGRRVIFFTLEESVEDILIKLYLSDLYANANKEERTILQNIAAQNRDMIKPFLKARKNSCVTCEKNENFFIQKVLEVQEKIDGFYGDRLFILDGHRSKTSEEQTAIIKKYAKSGDIVLIDYVQRIADPENKRYSNYLKGQVQSNTLFNLAKDTNAVVISGAQFNRAVSELPKELAPLGFKPFDISSFREAGDIEHDGDYLFGIGEHITESNKRFLKILKVRSCSGRDLCYSIDFQGAFYYMGKGEQLTVMNSTSEQKKSQKGRNVKNITHSSNPLRDTNER